MKIKAENTITSVANNLFSSVFITVVALITGVIINRSLGPTLKGQYAALYLVSTFYGPLLSFGYQGGVLYHGIRKEINFKSFFWAGMLLTLVIGCIIPVLFFPLIKIGIFGKIPASLSSSNIMIGVSIIPIILANGYMEKVIRSYNLFKASNFRIMAGAFITLLYYLLFFFTTGVTLVHVFWGAIVGQGVQFMISVFFCVFTLGFKPKLQFSQLFFPYKYGIKSWLNNLLLNYNDKLDQIILNYLLTPGGLGLYTVGVGLSNLIGQIPSSYLNVFYNQVAGTDQRGAVALYIKAQRINIIVSLIVFFGMLIVGYPLIVLMYGSQFKESFWVLIIYAPGVVFQAAARLSIKFYGGIGKPLKNSLIYLFGIIVSLPFYFLLIPLFGINGAAIGSSIAYASAFLFSFYQIKREFNVSLIEIFDFKKADLLLINEKIKSLPILQKFKNRVVGVK